MAIRDGDDHTDSIPSRFIFRQFVFVFVQRIFPFPFRSVRKGCASVGVGCVAARSSHLSVTEALVRINQHVAGLNLIILSVGCA